MFTAMTQAMRDALQNAGGTEWNCYFFEGPAPSTLEEIPFDYESLNEILHNMAGYSHLDMVTTNLTQFEFNLRQPENTEEKQFCTDNGDGTYYVRPNYASHPKTSGNANNHWTYSEAHLCYALGINYDSGNGTARYKPFEFRFPQEVKIDQLDIRSPSNTSYSLGPDAKVEYWDGNDYVELYASVDANYVIDMQGITTSRVRITSGNVPGNRTIISQPKFITDTKYERTMTPTWCLVAPRATNNSVVGDNVPKVLMSVSGPLGEGEVKLARDTSETHKANPMLVKFEVGTDAG